MMSFAHARYRRAQARYRTFVSRCGTYEEACESMQELTNFVMREVQSLDRLPEDRRQQALAGLAATSVLLEERKKEVNNLQTVLSKSVRPLTAAEYACMYAVRKLDNYDRKVQALSGIISRIECDTFYWDLMVWLVVPGGHSEELLGDLNEEYLLRIESHGEAGARAWYRDQATTTIWDCLWTKIERLAAVGTLIDLLRRWFRN